jgi:hypothetical protein
MMSKNVSLHQTGGCIRMVDEETGEPYWQTFNESSKDREPAMGPEEPIIMDPRHFQLGTALAVMEPDAPVSREDAAAHALEGQMSGKPPQEWVNVRREGPHLIVEWTHGGQTVELGRELLDSNFSSGWNLTVRKSDKAAAPTPAPTVEPAR